jgi:mRNA-degrading endonuclease YafQ of YafQ-DinJ toxin-antitoxin module
VRVTPTRGFERKLRKLPRERQTAVNRALARFIVDPADAGLALHKLSGELSGRWAFSAGYDLRVVCRIEGDLAYLLLVGTHDEVY